MDRIEEASRLREAFAAVAEVELGDEHFDSERIWKAVSGELSRRETLEVVDRAAASAAVAEAWRLARAMRTEMEGEVRAVTSTSRRSAAGIAWWALAAAAVVVLVAGLWPRLDRVSPPPVYRSADPPDLVSLLADDAELERDDLLLRWTPVPGEGWRYRVTVADESLAELVASEPLADTEFLVPVESLQAAEGGARLYWQVEAETPDGRRLTSATFFVRIR